MPTLLENPDARSRPSVRPAPVPHRAQHTPTFVDDAGRRRRLAARAGRVLVAIAALWLAAVASAFLAFPALPAPALRTSATVASAVNGERGTGAAGARSAYAGNERRAPASGGSSQRLTTADRERPHPYRRGASAGRAQRQAPGRNTTGAVKRRDG